MLIVLIAVLVLGVLLFIYSKHHKSHKAQKSGAFILKQGVITLIMFNVFNFAFSAGIQWKYGQS